MTALHDHSNVYNTALGLLDRRGFQLWYDPELECYCAERDGWDFSSPTPTGLLGLVAIFEASKPSSFREYWWRAEGAPDYTALPNAPKPYRNSVGTREPRET